MKAILLILSVLPAVLKAANILIVAPMPFYSHTNTFIPVYKELAARGHNITMVSPFPQKLDVPNWRNIALNGSRQSERSIKEMINTNAYRFYSALYSLCNYVLDIALDDEDLHNFLDNDNTKYDLLIMEPYFCQEPFITLGHKFNVPVIAVHAMSLTPWYSFLTGNEVSLHLQPNLRSQYKNRMTFFERLDNFFINLFEMGVGYFHYIPHQQYLMDKFFKYPGSENRPPILNMLRNVSLILADYHMSVGYSEPLLPNTIPVGGLSLKIGDELPKDLNNVFENSKDGVIYLNFGSVLNSRNMPEGVFETVLAAMGKIDYPVLMRWDVEDVPNKPKNVILRKWYPQPAILAHPKLRIFITHAGLHSLTEAVYRGVPVLCIPVFADQKYDSRFAEQAGLGITIFLDELTNDRIINSVLTIIQDPSYKENALIRSKVVQDRQNTAMESAIYWIEYVIRHNGANHLKPARIELSLYQVLGLDIFLFLLTIALLPIILLSLLRRVKIPKTKKD
ncbi:unnamed protein product [Nezara viridula]|uniref:UDP-glucuronosyltransferase n=1 Tax=Nezara viridula TaxID=85310 RepID=A0A9P0HAR6_NEZVI|nr:unnamed protein product [Nezara viridula]